MLHKALPIILGVVSLPALATVNSGTYIGVELGTDNQIISFIPSAFNVSTNGAQLYNPNWGIAARVNLGYNFSKYNAIELAPSYYFSQNYNYPDSSSSTGINATSLDLSYIGSLPISESKWSVFGRAGLAYDWVNQSNGGSSCNCSTVANITPSGSNVADVLGAGFKYMIGIHSSLRIEWISNGLFFTNWYR